VQIDDGLHSLSSRAGRRQRHAQDGGMTAMQSGLPIVIVGQGVKRFGKLNMPLGALAVRQALEDRVLQQCKPFRVAVVFGDLEVLLVHVSDFIRSCIREDVMQMTTDRAALEVFIVALAVGPAQQHIGLEVGNGLLKQFCALFSVH
jgi:hypothetical protein